ncbi:Uncharacterised protein [Vibrio cholerae]|nr:Uncharacterised protein [Vibrio cholerae]CSC85887.1 Uncharacterised protein [Vibrio cholerae]CSI70486.1 Uncharacterised protein [Vibrio cholerae]CSI75277.1 Uncharacterised protein [Vibrio cholerae]
MIENAFFHHDADPLNLRHHTHIDAAIWAASRSRNAVLFIDGRHHKRARRERDFDFTHPTRQPHTAHYIAD